MDRTAIIRYVVAAFVGALVAVALLMVAVLVNAGHGFTQCTATTGAGWVVPLIAVMVIAVAGVSLLSGRRSGAPPFADFTSAICSECGGEVRGDWRLCPHCGSRLTPGEDE